ncbi:MAG: leucine-rich repeat domain-containing protein, partial [Muribaculaceae bacterium]|nr:leucine-rich repeat domain-containing protein [Muribaculaceae bacterium]
CSGLTSVIIPNSVTSIGEDAFYRCSGLIKSAYPNNLNNPFGYGIIMAYNPEGAIIEDGIIYGPEKKEILFATYDLTGQFIIPKSVTSIRESAFKSCSGLTSVIIHNSVTSIGDSAFESCNGLTSVIIPNSVSSIGKNTFNKCSGLIKSAYPNHLNDPFGDGIRVAYNPEGAIIEDGWIYGPEKRKILFAPYNLAGQFIIPENVTSIGQDAFKGCSGLTSLIISTSVTSIGNYAFYGCTDLTSIRVLSEQPASLSDNAFLSDQYYDPYDKVELNIPTEFISAYLSTNWGQFKNIRPLGCDYVLTTYSDDVLRYRLIPSINGGENKAVVIQGDYNGEISIPERFSYTDENGQTSRYYVDAIGYKAFSNSSISKIDFNSRINLKTIGTEAFSNCRISSITIPASVEVINTSAFQGCYRLTSITIPDNVTTIGDYAFSGCSKLPSLIIPDKVTSIGAYALSDCSSLKSVSIGSSVKYIGASAFKGCDNLNKAEFTSIEQLCKIYFADSHSNPLTFAQNLYINGEEIHDLVIPNTVESIGFAAFFNGSNLTSVTIPNSVISIGRYAFYSCSGLISVTIPNSVVSIGESAFDNCIGLKIANFESIESLCKIQFSDMTSNPLYWAKNLYVNNENITELAIPNSIESIGNWAFSGCSELRSIEIPAVNEFGKGAFSGCSGVTSIKLGNRVMNIESSVFEDCKSLQELTISDGTTPISLSGDWLSRIRKLYMGREIEIN